MLRGIAKIQPNINHGVVCFSLILFYFFNLNNYHLDLLSINNKNVYIRHLSFCCHKNIQRKWGFLGHLEMVINMIKNCNCMTALLITHYFYGNRMLFCGKLTPSHRDSGRSYTILKLKKHFMNSCAVTDNVYWKSNEINLTPSSKAIYMYIQ